MIINFILGITWINLISYPSFFGFKIVQMKADQLNFHPLFLSRYSGVVRNTKKIDHTLPCGQAFHLRCCFTSRMQYIVGD